MLKKYSHFPDLQATDKYKKNFTKARMYASLTGHAPSLQGCLQLGGGREGLKNSEKPLLGEGRSNIFILVRGGGSNFVWGGGCHIILD